MKINNNNNNNIKIKKKIIREKISNARNSLTPEEHKIKSKLITEKLLGLSDYIKANTIFIYYPFRSEIDTTEIIKDALSNNKKVVLPKVTGESLKIFFISDIKRDLKPGSYGILEPDINNCTEANLNKIDLAIVPGLCFDLNFNRIGYGGGFYDKILSKLRKNVKVIALAFDLQIVNNLPACAHDKKVNIIITESRIYKDFKIDK
ncbi:MAG: 5-formyltetrahydrofolate cyclo-ligase [Actinobacteria bacterium]|nr:5-formyltetrahydrofolate cyclo-ligase [Actinomycetota bacterium]